VDLRCQRGLEFESDSVHCGDGSCWDGSLVRVVEDSFERQSSGRQNSLYEKKLCSPGSAAEMIRETRLLWRRSSFEPCVADVGVQD
jgi:hypothetical protein